MPTLTMKKENPPRQAVVLFRLSTVPRLCRLLLQNNLDTQDILSNEGRQMLRRRGNHR